MTIRIQDLTFEAVIGILDFEREAPQRVSVDCAITYSGEYVDYARVREIIRDTIRQGRFGLIEEALEALCIRIQGAFPQIALLRLEVAKPDIFDDCLVSVVTERNFS